MCKKMAERDVSIVSVQLAADTYTRNTRSLRATPGDKIGTLGGTLGLFTGMSVISIIEAVYWLSTALVRAVVYGVRRKVAVPRRRKRVFAIN